MRADSFFTSSMVLTTLTPPALPRPPAWICAFTTQTGPPSSWAPLSASSTLNAGTPRGTGTPNSRNTALAWYSWIFINHLRMGAANSELANSGSFALLFATRYFAIRLTSQIRRYFLTSLDQALHRGHRLFELATFTTAELDLDDALDALGADHHRHADIKVLEAVFAVEPS